ncbi:hypothetical protein EHS19_07465 [Bifidobacterium jacchi]|uniref:Integrase n=1 Tax=Bifidobacterium jacchi TaxID=2490545 RepID=A0A5N5RHN2_9BIFI|nr:hypothetical protein EHS19_07465 [Bifidobacterium jacchi]
MANITKYTTSRGETRYRVRYRKPDGSQTDKRVPSASLCCFVAYRSIVWHRPAHSSEGVVPYSTDYETPITRQDTSLSRNRKPLRRLGEETPWRGVLSGRPGAQWH